MNQDGVQLDASAEAAGDRFRIYGAGFTISGFQDSGVQEPLNFSWVDPVIVLILEGFQD